MDTREDQVRDFAEGLTARDFEVLAKCIGASIIHARILLREIAVSRFGEDHGSVTCVFRDGNECVGGTITVPAARAGVCVG